MKKQDIITAYLEIRKTNNNIPDEVLDFMKASAIEKLKGEKEKRSAKMEQALMDIIDECPNPKLPYACKIVEIAKNALTVPYIEK